MREGDAGGVGLGQDTYLIKANGAAFCRRLVSWVAIGSPEDEIDGPSPLQGAAPQICAIKIPAKLPSQFVLGPRQV